jgi:xyloglucan:xyloglucosyl transferase
MYFYWGAHHSAILGNGDDLQLVLDQTSGNDLLFHQIIAFL